MSGYIVKVQFPRACTVGHSTRYGVVRLNTGTTANVLNANLSHARFLNRHSLTYIPLLENELNDPYRSTFR